jgi:predicted acetyltransferase
MTAIINRQLGELEESVALLWSSEGRIYPRFGFGLASLRLGFEVSSREVTLPDPKRGTVRAAPPLSVRPQLEEVYERVWRHRPGWSERDATWWSYVLGDPAAWRRGAGERSAFLYERDGGGVEGYALWRGRAGWDARGPIGSVLLEELVAETTAAYLTLWRCFLEMDLTRSVRYYFGAVDEPLLRLADEPRQLGATVADGLYLRILDVRAALQARSYSVPVDLVIEVSDGLLRRNEGRWRLTADASGSTCDPTSSPPGVRVDIRDLSATYLGGTSLGQLWCAGRIEECRPGSVDLANAAFGWRRAASGIEMF